MDALIDLPFALPTIVAGLVLLTLYGTNSPLGINIAYTRAGVVVALLFVTLPFVVRTVQPVLQTLDRDITVFVTHDQEEAIDVADSIVVLAGGVIEQVGSPRDVYDNPSSPFVMRFLGPVTQVGDRLVRPHDIEVSVSPGPDSVPAVVTRVVRLGFEVRLEMKARGEPTWAQVTRDVADRLGVVAGTTVHIRPTAGARSMPAGPAQMRPST